MDSFKNTKNNDTIRIVKAKTYKAMKEEFSMKKKMVSVLLAAAMGATGLVGFGSTAYAAPL